MADDYERAVTSGAQLRQSISPKCINPGDSAAEQVFAHQELKAMILHQVFAETSVAAGEEGKIFHQLTREHPAYSAVDKVFGTNELVESILEQLPLKDVARAQAVCKNFHKLTMRSKRIGYGEAWFKEAETVPLGFDRQCWERKWNTSINFDNNSRDSTGHSLPHGHAKTGGDTHISVHFYAGMDHPPANTIFARKDDGPEKTSAEPTLRVGQDRNELWRRFRIAEVLNIILLFYGRECTARCRMTPQSTLGDMCDWLLEEFELETGQTSWPAGVRPAQDFDSVTFERVTYNFEHCQDVDPITRRITTQ